MVYFGGYYPAFRIWTSIVEKIPPRVKKAIVTAIAYVRGSIATLIGRGSTAAAFTRGTEARLSPRGATAILLKKETTARILTD